MAPYYPQAYPQSWPLGQLLPPCNPHAVSTSMPAWDHVVQWGGRTPEILDKLKGGYPRFFIHRFVQQLSSEVLSRLQLVESNCMIFPSPAVVSRCIGALADNASSKTIRVISFSLPRHSGDDLTPEEMRWASFEAVIYPPDIHPAFLAFWRESGEGISSRHAQYVLSYLDQMTHREHGGDLSSPISVTLSPQKSGLEYGEEAKRHIRTSIAKLVTGERGTNVTPHDVFLFPSGMSAIYAVSRALKKANLNGSGSVVIYGFPYSETVKSIEMTQWRKFTLYGHGNKIELDQLEDDLISGHRISALFCEIPSNPQLRSPDLRRLRTLADKYDFAIACDDTIGSFINVNILPYVDIVMTSLTKSFSGGSDVMGGSVVVNPRSAHFHSIFDAVLSEWEDNFFPADAITLSKNCSDVVSRVLKSSFSAEAIANFINGHPSVKRVNYPSLVESRKFYEQVKRKDGGYGSLMSIIFHEPTAAIEFYDNLDVPKGPSLGTNFTLAIPYAFLAHFRELDWAASYDVPRHIVRISVGLEDTEKLLRVVEKALGCISTNLTVSEE